MQDGKAPDDSKRLTGTLGEYFFRIENSFRAKPISHGQQNALGLNPGGYFLW